MRRSLVILIIVDALLLLAAVALGVVTLVQRATPPPPTPTSLPTPTSTPLPTPSPTPVPTATPSPSPTRRPSPTPTPTPTPRPLPQYGVSVHLYGLDRGRALDLAKEAGFGWIRQQVWWRDVEPWKGHYDWGELDSIVSDANARGIKVLLSIVRSPGWAAGGSYGLPYDPEDLGDFLYEMASHYRGQVQAYEIWNEPNLAVENAGRVADPGKYVELLHVAYRRIKEADPAARVISAALTPTGVSEPWLSTDDLDYLRAMLAYRDGLLLQSCDAVGAHGAGTHNPPDTLWPDWPGPGPGWLDHPTHYFRHLENVHAALQEFGTDKPIWITEFGWATANWTPGYGYGFDNSEEDQANYLVRALQIVEQEWPWVQAAFIWNLNFAVVRGNWNEQGAFGILYDDWSPRPAYLAVQQHLLRVQGQRSSMPEVEP
jgi:hypothetical protein